MSHRCRILGLSCPGPQGRIWALPQDPQLLKEPRVVSPLPLMMVCVVSFPGKDGEVLSLCQMPEHLVQLKSKVDLRGLGCPWGAEGCVLGSGGPLGPPLSPVVSPGPGAHLLQLCITLWHLGRLLHGLPLPSVPREL